MSSTTLPNGLPRADDRRTRPAIARRHVVGDMRVTCVPDGYVELGLDHVMLGADAHVDPWREHALDGRYLVASIAVLLVESSSGKFLVDAGIGPVDLPRERTSPLLGAIYGGHLLRNLELLGYVPADIDGLVFTHPHDDHIGWARNDRRGAPTPPFAHATHFVGAADVDEWQARLASPRRTDNPRLALLDDGDVIVPGIRAIAAPGHTPGHLCLELESGGERLVVLGDLVHSAAQVTSPATPCTLDEDPVLAARTRAAVLDRVADQGGLAYGGHLADTVFGRVSTRDGGRVWSPLPD